MRKRSHSVFFSEIWLQSWVWHSFSRVTYFLPETEICINSWVYFSYHLSCWGQYRYFQISWICICPVNSLLRWRCFLWTVKNSMLNYRVMWVFWNQVKWWNKTTLSVFLFEAGTQHEKYVNARGMGCRRPALAHPSLSLKHQGSSSHRP